MFKFSDRQTGEVFISPTPSDEPLSKKSIEFLEDRGPDLGTDGECLVFRMPMNTNTVREDVNAYMTCDSVSLLKQICLEVFASEFDAWILRITNEGNKGNTIEQCNRIKVIYEKM